MFFHFHDGSNSTLTYIITEFQITLFENTLISLVCSHNVLSLSQIRFLMFLIPIWDVDIPEKTTEQIFICQSCAFYKSTFKNVFILLQKQSLF